VDAVAPGREGAHGRRQDGSDRGAKAKDRKAAVAADERDFQGAPLDLSDAETAPTCMNVVRGAGRQSLMGPFPAVPEGIRSELPLQRGDRPKEQEPPGELPLHCPPESVDPRQVRLSQGGESPPDALPGQHRLEEPRSETSHLGLPWWRIASRRSRQAPAAPGSEGHTLIARTFLDNASSTAPTTMLLKKPPT